MLMAADFVGDDGLLFDPDTVTLTIRGADGEVSQTLTADELRHPGVGRYEYDYPLQEGEEPPLFLFTGTIR
ncbi:MAG: hypothetical protein ABFE02_10970 [Sulfuricella sp.]